MGNLASGLPELSNLVEPIPSSTIKYGSPATQVSEQETLDYIHSVHLSEFEFPTELVQHIVSFVRDYNLITRFSIVSKRIYNQLWSNIAEYNEDRITNGPRALLNLRTKIATHANRIKNLGILIDAPSINGLSEIIAKQAATLHRLAFYEGKPPHETILDDSSLLMRGLWLTKLNELELVATSTEFACKLISASPNVQKLTIERKYFEESFDILLNAAKSCAQLEKLVIRGPSTELDELQDYFYALPQLRTIQFTPKSANLIQLGNILYGNDLTRQESLYRSLKNTRRILVDLTPYDLPVCANQFYWLLSSKSPTLVDLVLKDSQISASTLSETFRDFLHYSAFNHSHDELMHIFRCLCERGIDLSSASVVPTLGFAQTPFEMIFRYGASRDLINYVFFYRHVNRANRTLWEEVCNSNASYPSFWARSLYFTCATGYSSSSQLISLLEEFDERPQRLQNVAGSDLRIGNVFSRSFDDLLPIHCVRNAQVAEYLLDLGRNSLAVDLRTGWSALSYATLAGIDVLRVFIAKSGAEIAHQNDSNPGGLSVLDFYIQESQAIDSSIIDLLADSGISATSASKGSLIRLALHYFHAPDGLQRLQSTLKAIEMMDLDSKKHALSEIVFQSARDILFKVSYPNMFAIVAERLHLNLERWIYAFQEEYDQILTCYKWYEVNLVVLGRGGKMPLLQCLCTFALPRSLELLLSSLAKSKYYQTLLPSFKAAHLFSMLTHASCLYLGNIDEYFAVASILIDYGILDLKVYDTHTLDFLPSHTAIEAWHAFVLAHT